MIGIQVSAALAVMSVAATTLAPIAHAADVVTYEIVSDSIPMLNNVEYVDSSGRKLIENIPLPWRRAVTLDDPTGPTGRGAQLRADWRPLAWPNRYVVVRIFSSGKLLCQSALDVGNATCYGNTPFMP
jgi:hypothetical protein